MPLMTQFKGTKKEWHVVDFSGFLQIQDGKYYEDNDILDCEAVGDIEAQANALLISKAPQLLETLTSLIESLEEEVLSTSINQEISEAKKLIKSSTEL